MGITVEALRTKARAYRRALRSLISSGTLSEMDRHTLSRGVVWLYDFLKLIYLSIRVSHSFGPKTVSLNRSEALVLCLVRDGELWIKEFVEHYFAKGFKHIVFLDTGSTDQTLNIARQYSNVTVLETRVPFKDHDLLFRRYLVKKFAKNAWSLTADIDEFWDYPHSDTLKLKMLLVYLNESGANAMVAQTLDMFMPELPTDAVESLKLYDHYDHSAIKKDALDQGGGYRDHGFYSRNAFCKNIQFYRGGIRAKKFGMEDIWLTKMPLIFFDNHIHAAEHQHFSNNAMVADLTSVLFHYKFTHNFREKIQDALEQKQYFGDSVDYQDYAETLTEASRFQFTTPSMRRFKSIENLVKEDFLTVSKSFLAFVQKHNESQN